MAAGCYLLRCTQQHGWDNDEIVFVNDYYNEEDDDGKKSDGCSNNNKITPVDRFMFVSESCLPVVTMDEMEMALFGPR